MYHLISVVLRKPNILYETDPLPDLLTLWQQQGVPNAMILEKVDLQDLGTYYANALGLRSRRHSIDDARFLFEIPDRATPAVAEGADNADGYRMLLTIMEGSEQQIEILLDQTEATIRTKLPDASELIFVFPLAHVRGFPGV